MRILITGANGFVGKNLIKFLSNHELFMPSRAELDLIDPITVVLHGPTDGNQRVLNSMRSIAFYLMANQIDAIIHLAGNVGGIGYNKNNQGKLGFENLQMGLNILEAARLANIKKLIMLGTTCSYPHIPKTIPFVEEELFDGMPELTNSGYGIAKRTLIKLSMEYAKQYNMNIVNLIPTNMYGPHDHFQEEKSHVIPALIKKFENPEFFENNFGEKTDHSAVMLWGTGSASRDFLYVDDCSRAIAIALERDIGPEPINLGTGNEVTIKGLAETIKKVGRYDAEIFWDKKKPDGQPRRSLDISRAKKTLNWIPMTTIDSGLKKTIEWYRNGQTKN